MWRSSIGKCVGRLWSSDRIVPIVPLWLIYEDPSSNRLTAASPAFIMIASNLGNLERGMQMNTEKLVTYILDGKEVPAGTPGATVSETAPISPEKGLYEGGMTKGSCNYRTALFVDGGSISAEQSVTAAITGGSYDDKQFVGGTIDSDHAHFNGVMVNDSEYAIRNLTMTADGSGGNDFKGYGAGIACYGKSSVTADGYVFSGAGVVRHGVFAGGNAPEDDLTVTVKNSFVKANGSKYESAAEGMSSCPWMLGISPDGHARATMVDGYAHVNYENDILLSDGWGVLSVDDTGDTKEFGAYSIEMQVKDSVIDVTTEGTDDPSCYATYSIGGCRNRFYGCTVGNGTSSQQYETLKAALPETGISYDYQTKKYGMTYAAVVANEHASAGWYDGCNVTTKYGVMYHKTNNVRYVPDAEDDSSASLPACGVTEVQDSAFHTQGAAFLIKACTPIIDVKNSKFQSDKGVIVQLMTCDDPGMGTPAYSEVIDISAPVDKDPGYNPYGYNRKDQKLFRKFDVKNMISDPQVSFTDCNAKNGTALEGNFYNSINVATNGEGMIWWGQNLILSFDNCDIQGACTSAVAVHDRYSYYMVPADNQYGGIPVNAEGFEIAGKWDKPSFGPPMPMDDAPGGPPDMGGMPEMPSMGEMPPMPAPKFYFTPDYDAQGNLVVIGKEALKPELGCIVSRDATYLGDLTNTAAPTVNNGVWVSLKNGSTWTPVGTSYLTRLEISGDSNLAGTVTVDGIPVIPDAGTIYTGAIVVTG